MSHDGLPLTYTTQEIYDRVVEHRCISKKLMDSVADTAFLAGAEYASLQAAACLVSAELLVNEELGMTERADQELLVVERENTVRVGKEEN
jgi:hypothetical protein